MTLLEKVYQRNNIFWNWYLILKYIEYVQAILETSLTTKYIVITKKYIIIMFITNHIN